MHRRTCLQAPLRSHSPSRLCSLQCGDASGTGLFDTANRTYDTKRMQSIDTSLPGFFPELIGPNEVSIHLQSPLRLDCGISAVFKFQKLPERCKTNHACTASTLCTSAPAERTSVMWACQLRQVLGGQSCQNRMQSEIELFDNTCYRRLHFLLNSTGCTQIVGHLRPEVAKELGLTEEVAVAPGSGDNQMSALGAGAVKEGAWVVSLGTSGGSQDRPMKAPMLCPAGACWDVCCNASVKQAMVTDWHCFAKKASIRLRVPDQCHRQKDIVPANKPTLMPSFCPCIHLDGVVLQEHCLEQPRSRS